MWTSTVDNCHIKGGGSALYVWTAGGRWTRHLGPHPGPDLDYDKIHYHTHYGHIWGWLQPWPITWASLIPFKSSALPKVLNKQFSNGVETPDWHPPETQLIFFY